MKRWLRILIRRLTWLLASRKPKADRSSLLGMYLNQVNSDQEHSLHGSTRERRDGKYAQNRQRV